MDSPDFTPVAPRIERSEARMYDTDLGTGEIRSFLRITTILTQPSGAVVYGPTEDRTMDYAEAYTALPTGYIADIPALVRISTQSITVSGSDPSRITVPEHAEYAEIYVEDSGIRWTKDGSDPAVGNGEQEMPGTSIKLTGVQDITGFRAKVIDVTGALVEDGSEQARLTVTVYNANPELQRMGGTATRFELLYDTNMTTGVWTPFVRQTDPDGTETLLDAQRAGEYTPSGTVDDLPTQVLLQSFTRYVGGYSSDQLPTGQPLGTISEYANHVTVLTQVAGDGSAIGIRYTLDGTKPNESSLYLQNGRTISMTREQAVGFRARVRHRDGHLEFISNNTSVNLTVRSYNFLTSRLQELL